MEIKSESFSGRIPVTLLATSILSYEPWDPVIIVNWDDMGKNLTRDLTKDPLYFNLPPHGQPLSAFKHNCNQLKIGVSFPDMERSNLESAPAAQALQNPFKRMLVHSLPPINLLLPLAHWKRLSCEFAAA